MGAIIPGVSVWQRAVRTWAGGIKLNQQKTPHSGAFLEQGSSII
jgi:hypothetical protein